MLFAYPIRLDLEVSHALQFYHPTWLTQVAKFVSFIGSPMIVALLVLVLLAVWYVKHRRTEMVRLVLVSFGNLLTIVTKLAFERDRPQPGLVLALSDEVSFSFPSGHSLCAILVGGYFWFISTSWPPIHRRVTRWLAAVFVLAIGWSRIYLGVHWLTDVVAGYLIGFVWLWLVAIFWPLIKRAMMRHKTI